jgi:hypothetical protein
VSDIRTAILQAADQIERNPASFRFSELYVPKTIDGCGCALGWIGYFLGGQGRRIGFVSRELGAATDLTFYMRMAELKTRYDRYRQWSKNAGVCAHTLRAYADKYHPRTDFIPTEVRELFTPAPQITEAPVPKSLLRRCLDWVSA